MWPKLSTHMLSEEENRVVMKEKVANAYAKLLRFKSVEFLVTSDKI